jgi:nucleotide-binding universal stress UspA family protein
MNPREGLTIVVGYDGSDAARRALVRVRDLEPRAARVLLVAVAPDLRSAGLQSQLAGGTFDAARLTEEATDLLDAPSNSSVELRTMTGDPAVVLVEVAREVAADLLVVGRRGGDFVVRTLLGSVAERVVQQAPCDVLVVA